MKPRGFTTRSIHEPALGKDAHGALRIPTYDTAAFGFASAEDMADSFSGRRAAHAYTRISNPTVDAFERKIAALESGLAAVGVASGMAAISATFLNLLAAGENIVSTASLFGGTYTFFQKILTPFGVETRFVPADDLAAMEAAIDGKTRAIFTETISNPGMIVPDFAAISAIARRHRIPLIADSTVTTPYLFSARDFGVNVVLHSTTKYISGGATSMGGIIVDLGNFDWSQIPALKDYHRFRDMAFLARLRKEIYRETGSCLAPHNAYLQTLGLETLALRMERIGMNANGLAAFLSAHRAVKSVQYPGLALSPFHDLAKRQFRGFGGILSLNLFSPQACFRFLNGLSLISRASNLGDNKTLALHAASTIFAGLTNAELKRLGVDDTLIRISFGIEDSEDLREDIAQALEGIEI
ncbi:MAG: aminotransferase class I/II-fold pyridoxal phosphate-dependent enzyme [Deltaproteobacteria bacterium]